MRRCFGGNCGLAGFIDGFVLARLQAVKNTVFKKANRVKLFQKPMPALWYPAIIKLIDAVFKIAGDALGA
jgi:hypothetical protein